MKRLEQRNVKIEAIYELREAAEQKVRAELAVDREGTAAARDAFLEARLKLESKTQDAIEVCHECGRVHSDDPQAGHAIDSGRRDNVVNVDFRSGERPD